MNLIIIRHGETDENRRGLVHGDPKGALNELGKKQAQEAAIKLKDEDVAAIYSSDYERCAETAKLLHVYHLNVPLRFTSDLREMGGGKMNRVRIPPKYALRGIKLLKFLHLKAPGGESWKELSNRVGRFLNQINEEYPNRTVILVTHGITMQAIRELVKGSKIGKFKLREVPNCTIWKMNMKNSISVQNK